MKAISTARHGTAEAAYVEACDIARNFMRNDDIEDAHCVKVYAPAKLGEEFVCMVGFWKSREETSG